MRDVKFRGKRVGKEGWVYGYYWVNLYSKTHFIMQPSKKGIPDILNTPVDPETVGQYTGFKDKTGKAPKEVYGDDIIAFTIFDHNGYDIPFIGKVFWDEEDAGWNIKTKGDSIWLLGQVLRQDDEAEVIGNIHDNPELLTANGKD